MLGLREFLAGYKVNAIVELYVVQLSSKCAHSFDATLMVMEIRLRIMLSSAFCQQLFLQIMHSETLFLIIIPQFQDFMNVCVEM